MLNRPVLFLQIVVLAGIGGSSALAAPSSSWRSNLLTENYPAESLARGEEGKVAFKVEIDSDGGLKSCAVTASSGYSRLDRTTCDLIVAHVEFPRAQTADGKKVATTRIGHVVWKLPPAYADNAASAAPPRSFTTAELEAQRLFCKRSPVVGSKIKAQTYCLTRNEWDQAIGYAQQTTQQLMNPYQTE